MTEPFAPPELRKTPTGREVNMTWLVKRHIEKHYGIEVCIDGTGMAWIAIKNNKRIAGPASSLTMVVWGALLEILEEKKTDR